MFDVQVYRLKRHKIDAYLDVTCKKFDGQFQCSCKLGARFAEQGEIRNSHATAQFFYFGNPGTGISQMLKKLEIIFD